MPIPRRNPALPHAVPGDELSDTIAQAGDRSHFFALQDELQDKRALEASEVLHRGPYETLYITDQRIPTPGGLGWNAVAFTVIQFRVPLAYVLALTELGIAYSESILAQSTAVGWRLAIDGIHVPNVVRSQFTFPGSDWAVGCLGDGTRTITINPVWVQANQTVQLQCTDLTGAMTEFICITGILAGKLYPSVRGAV